MDVVYSVLATLCRSTMLRLCIVSPGAVPLLLLVDKECGDLNEPHKGLECAATNT